MIYYYPNRPHLLPPDSPEIDKCSDSGEWVAELKMNGSNCMLYKENGGYKFFDRHGKLLVYSPTDELLQELNNLNIPDKSILNAELLHTKTTVTKNTLFFHCIVQWNNKLYNGVTYKEQRKQLVSLFKNRRYKRLLLAEHYKKDFRKVFENVIKADKENLVEGLVLKNLAGKINVNTNSSSEVWWMIKVRKPNKNYIF